LEVGLPRTIVSRDVTFDENSFIRDDKIEDQKDAKGKSKAVEIEQQDEIHDAAIDSQIDQAADQQDDSAGSSSLDSGEIM